MTPPPAPESLSDARICAEILHQVEQRGADKSICPSEVARALFGQTPPIADGAAWQSLLGSVRRAAIALAREGRIDILRKGQPVGPLTELAALKGVIRLRRR
jgi:hypothetical protein